VERRLDRSSGKAGGVNVGKGQRLVASSAEGVQSRGQGIKRGNQKVEEPKVCHDARVVRRLPDQGSDEWVGGAAMWLWVSASG